MGNIGLSHDEQVSHFALWCLITGPLLISTDLNSITNETLSILTHEELIAVNQDPNGLQGIRVSGAAPIGGEVRIRQLSDGTVAVMFLNRGGASIDITASWSLLGLKNGTKVSIRDMWKRKDIASDVSDNYVAKSVAPHAVAALKFTPE